MATTSRNYDNNYDDCITYLSGETELELHQFLTQVPEDVLAQHNLGPNNPPTIYWCAAIHWHRMKVVVTIGDYIMASWYFGEEITFENSKGYGPDHVHTYIDMFPSQIVDDIMKEFAPKL